jgi:Kelch motif
MRSYVARPHVLAGEFVPGYLGDSLGFLPFVHADPLANQFDGPRTRNLRFGGRPLEPRCLNSARAASRGGSGIKDKLYVIAGFIEGWTPTDDVHEYDPASDRWQQLAALPTRCLPTTFIRALQKASAALCRADSPAALTAAASIWRAFHRLGAVIEDVGARLLQHISAPATRGHIARGRRYRPQRRHS